MKKIKCHLIIHSKIGHLNQIFTGFMDLKKRGLVEVSIEKRYTTTKQILEVIINDKTKVIYDTLDEECFYAATEMNIEGIDYYFKRSFRNEVANKFSFKSFPLGINYNVYSEYGNLLGAKEEIKNKIKKILKKEKYKYVTSDFEYFPIVNSNPTICFLTRVWDTNAKEIENEKIREERVIINQFRVDCIRECRKKFGDKFIGGIEDSEFARNNFEDCIITNKSITKRDNFMDLVKNTDICIATTGLHNSIGWKFGEYIAASRAILTEPLYYKLPGKCINNKNYLTFTSVDELINSIELLIEDKDKRLEMMINNYNYYNSYVKPQMLIMNTLTKMVNLVNKENVF